MIESKNIKDYIAKAVIFKEELSKLDSLKERFARFTYLFPSNEDKMICKAIFDVKFISNTKERKFVSEMVDGINALMPKKISEMIDVYNQTTSIVYNLLEKENKLVSDSDGERSAIEVKQGSEKSDDKHGRAADPFIVMSTQDPNRDYEGGEIVKKDGKTIISTISKAELDAAKTNAEVQNKQRQAESERKEAEKRAAYEKSLQERRLKKENAKVSSEIQKILNSQD